MTTQIAFSEVNNYSLTSNHANTSRLNQLSEPSPELSKLPSMSKEEKLEFQIKGLMENYRILSQELERMEINNKFLETNLNNVGFELRNAKLRLEELETENKNLKTENQLLKLSVSKAVDNTCQQQLEQSRMLIGDLKQKLEQTKNLIEGKDEEKK